MEMHEQRFSMRKVVSIAAVLFVLGFFAGNMYHAQSAISAAPEGAPSGADMTPFYKAWGLLEKNFVATATTTNATSTPEEQVYGAIEGLAASYGDPYTAFFPPKENGIFQSQVAGDFGGVGMEIGIKENVLTVISPLKDTPASRAGIESGDVVLSINDESTAGMSVDDAVSKIRGKEGTTVVLELSRKGGKSFTVSVVRATINLPTVDTELRPDGVFVVHVYTFNAQAPAKFRDALREFALSNSDKLLIDLRGNPGGYLEVAVDMASWFLPVGKVVVTEDYGAKQSSIVERSRGYDVFNDTVKIAILIDQGSASASEIFAGALHDYHRATLIGQRSFGKGSVQQLFDITPDTSLKVTIARWLTPSGISISHEGIEPDISVPITEEDSKAGRDPQLERAAQFLTSGQ